MVQPQSRGKYLVITIAVFGLVGLGLGLTGYIGMSFAQDTFVDPTASELEQGFGELFVAIVFFQSMIVTLFAGPIVAGVTGLISGVTLHDRVSSAIVGGVGAFIGFYVMVITAIFIMSLGLSSNSGDGGSSADQGMQLSQMLSPVIKAALPTTVVGLGSGLLGTLFAAE